MGCGTSTSVQTFKNEENKSYQHHQQQRQQLLQQQQQAQKQQQRQPSAQSKKCEEKFIRPNSTTSERSFKKNENRINSGSTKKTYTIQRDNSAKLDTATPEAAPVEKQFQHDNLQKETFLTGNYRRQEVSGDPFGEIKPKESRSERHERRAREIEEIHATADYEKREEEDLKEYDLPPIIVPPMEDKPAPDPDENESKEYTIDDIVAHNTAKQTTDWFKYGKKVYSWSLMMPLALERMRQYCDKTVSGLYLEGYPICVVRSYGITRKDLKQLLEYCYIGKAIDVPIENYLSRMKDDVLQVLEEEGDGEYLNDYKDQLNRWVRAYPNNQINPPLESGKDPNTIEFPLPEDTLNNLSDLRKGIDFAFDTELPEESYFDSGPNIYTDFGNEHEYFSELVASHVDASIPEMMMEIDGDVAWIQIELDLFKNDCTTEKQNDTIAKRAMRTNLDDENWMATRREAIFQSLIIRHEWDPSKVYPYRDFFDRLVRDWKVFQELCEGDFIPPARKDKNVSSVTSTCSGAIEDGPVELVVRPSSKSSQRSIRSNISAISNRSAKSSGRSSRSSKLSQHSMDIHSFKEMEVPPPVLMDSNNSLNEERPKSKSSIRSDRSTLTLEANGDDRPQSSASAKSNHTLQSFGEEEEDFTNGPFTLAKYEIENDNQSVVLEPMNANLESEHVLKLDSENTDVPSEADSEPKPALERNDSGLELDTPGSEDVDPTHNNNTGRMGSGKEREGSGSRCSEANKNTSRCSDPQTTGPDESSNNIAADDPER